MFEFYSLEKRTKGQMAYVWGFFLFLLFFFNKEVDVPVEKRSMGQCGVNAGNIASTSST